MSSENLLYSTVPSVNNSVLCAQKFVSLDLSLSVFNHTKTNIRTNKQGTRGVLALAAHILILEQYKGD